MNILHIFMRLSCVKAERSVIVLWCAEDALSHIHDLSCQNAVIIFVSHPFHMTMHVHRVHVHREPCDSRKKCWCFALFCLFFFFFFFIAIFHSRQFAFFTFSFFDLLISFASLLFSPFIFAVNLSNGCADVLWESECWKRDIHNRYCACLCAHTHAGLTNLISLFYRHPMSAKWRKCVCTLFGCHCRRRRWQFIRL